MSICETKVKDALSGIFPQSVTTEEHEYILKCFLQQVLGGKSLDPKGSMATLLDYTLHVAHLDAIWEGEWALYNAESELSVAAMSTVMGKIKDTNTLPGEKYVKFLRIFEKVIDREMEAVRITFKESPSMDYESVELPA